jgi:hypothetical protein
MDIIYDYLNRIKDFFIWFCEPEIHHELWEEIGPI